MKRLMTILSVACTVAACDASIDGPAEEAVFVVEVVPGETFRILLRDFNRVVEARSWLASGDPITVHGVLAEGDGGFNSGFSWHLIPASVTFVEIAMELCDGRPSLVEQELDYFLESVKYYCPWGATVVAEE